MAQAVSPAKQAGTKKRPARRLSGRTGSGCLVLNQGASDDRQEANPRQAETHGGRAIRVTLSGCYTASAESITVDYESRRRGSPICSLARKLLEAGYDPASPLLIYRGSTLCFQPAPLGKWAGLTVEEGDNSPKAAHFAKYRPTPGERYEITPAGTCRSGQSGARAFRDEHTPASPNAALAGNAQPSRTAGETSEDYPHVVANLSDRWRVILCSQGIQWIAQQRDRGGYKWRNAGYFTTSYWLRIFCSRLVSDPAAWRALESLPEHVSRARPFQVRGDLTRQTSLWPARAMRHDRAAGNEPVSPAGEARSALHGGR